jgi:hypothetical protein
LVAKTYDANNKTTATEASVEGFIAAVEPPTRREDARVVMEMMRRLSGEPPVLWGPSIIGFGRYRYRYESGREGEMCRLGFSPRKSATVVYLIDGFDRRKDLLDKLGPHTTGRSCLYIKRLADIDLSVLETLIADSLTVMNEKYPDGA